VKTQPYKPRGLQDAESSRLSSYCWPVSWKPRSFKKSTLRFQTHL